MIFHTRSGFFTSFRQNTAMSFSKGNGVPVALIPTPYPPPLIATASAACVSSPIRFPSLSIHVR